MTNVAIIPDVLSATYELMNSICKKIPAKGGSEEVLHVITSHQKDIKKIKVKVDPLIQSLNLVDKIEEKYLEIKLWSRDHTEYALPIIAWDYFVQSVVNSDEDTIIKSVVTIIPIVDRSFTDYYLQVH